MNETTTINFDEQRERWIKDVPEIETLTEKQQKFAMALPIFDWNRTKSMSAAGYLVKGNDADSIVKSPKFAYVVSKMRSILAITPAKEIGWTIEKSIEVAQTEMERWKEKRPEIAFKYKENLDKLNGLLWEKRELVLIHTDYAREIDHIKRLCLN